MKTFTFYQKNSSAIFIVSAPNYEDAREELKEHVMTAYGWRCVDEEGEDQ
jgi:hypothetical protein